MINKETIESFGEYVCHLISFFFPGLVLLDGIYEKGLFSGSVSSIYDFIFILIWALVLSLPFHFAVVFVDAESLLPEEKHKGRYYSMLELPYCAVLSFIIYAAFKILERYTLFGLDNSVVPGKHLRFFIAFFIGGMASWPLAKIYRFFLSSLNLKINEP